METKSVNEANERVRSAIANSLLEFPVRITSTSHRPGAHFDPPYCPLHPGQQRPAPPSRGRRHHVRGRTRAGGQPTARSKPSGHSSSPLPAGITSCCPASCVVGRMLYPADFMLVATMNPCPCGHLGDPSKECTCSTVSTCLSMSRGCRMTSCSWQKKKQNAQHFSGVEQILRAQKAQAERYKSSTVHNSSLSSSPVHKLLSIKPDARQLLSTAGERLGLSARSYFKITKVHIADALQYRGQTS